MMNRNQKILCCSLVLCALIGAAYAIPGGSPNSKFGNQQNQLRKQNKLALSQKQIPLGVGVTHTFTNKWDDPKEASGDPYRLIVPCDSALHKEGQPCVDYGIDDVDLDDDDEDHDDEGNKDDDDSEQTLKSREYDTGKQAASLQKPYIYSHFADDIVDHELMDDLTDKPEKDDDGAAVRNSIWRRLVVFVRRIVAIPARLFVRWFDFWIGIAHKVQRSMDCWAIRHGTISGSSSYLRWFVWHIYSYYRGPAYMRGLLILNSKNNICGY